MAIVWVDIETTGLDPVKHYVLEVAAVITDDKLVEIDRFERVIRYAWAERMLVKWGAGQNASAYDVDPFVLEMHAKNGLWQASADAAAGPGFVDRELAAFITGTVGAIGEKAGPQLGGSTISFDRAFLKADLPLTHATLHYRNVDVTTLNELSRRFWSSVYEARPRNPIAAHRAMADVEESLNVARHYVNALGPVIS